MNPNAVTTTRRRFLAAGGAAALGLWGAAQAQTEAQATKTKLLKAMIRSPITEENMRELKDAGFTGVEARRAIPDEEAMAARKIAEKYGIKIHSVMAGGDDLLANMKTAHAYGADTVLCVPGRIGKEIPMPEAWEYKVEFDPKNGHLTKVVEGDNAKYAKYIEQHNKVTDEVRTNVKALIPEAEKLGVVIALENVWNNLWVTPELAQWLVASFDSPWVQAYYDVGNNMKYGLPPEVWIRKLGKLIRRIHIKDWKYSDDKKSGKFVHPRDGSIEWPKVREAIEDAGYNGFLTIEDGGLELPEFGKRLDLIIAGK